MTKITAVAPGGDCPRWRAFLERVFDGDHEHISFMRRIVGSGLTGSTRGHALFFFYATGANAAGGPPPRGATRAVCAGAGRDGRADLAGRARR